MFIAEFVPLHPRRWRAAGVPAMPECLEPERVSTTESTEASDSREVQSRDEAQSHDAAAISAQVQAPPPLDDDTPIAEHASDDGEERAAVLREEAIRFAAIATARALRVGLAADTAALTRYVDDALQACGRVTRARIRLHPSDATLYRPRRDVDVVADPSSARGEIVVETEAGSVHATIENRAALLARAAAHA